MALSSAKIIVRRFNGRMAFVPEGRCDRSLARSAWESATQKSRPVGYGVIRVGVGTDSMIGVTHSESKNRKNLLYDLVPTGISCARPYRWTMSQEAMQRGPRSGGTS